LLEELESLCDELLGRVANYVEMASSSEEAQNKGLVLAVKLERVLSKACFGFAYGGSHSLRSMRDKLTV
jgi:hypothetical protein